MATRKPVQGPSKSWWNAETIVVHNRAALTDIKGEDITSHCVEGISAGVYRHHRLGVVVVVLSETITR